MSELNGMVQLPPVPTRITDPNELRLLAETLVAAAEAEVSPQFAPDPEPAAETKDQSPAKPKVFPPHAPRMARAWLWLIAQVQTPLRFKRAAIWSLRLPVRAWSFAKVIGSPKVDLETYAWRENACRDCPFRHMRARRTAAGIVLDEHCSKCSCPDWSQSRNSERNWYSGWLCPTRRHPGKYPDDDLREHLREHGYDPESVSGGGGCTGCGCGKAAR